ALCGLQRFFTFATVKLPTDQSGVWHISILLLFTLLQYYNTKTAVRQTKKCEIIAIKAFFYERSLSDLLFL
ncbi:hypothetical protein, partial [Phascolarctobacterium succinatutens]|uniref:hypothetical protein n=1 Tax=Phascolarctobacterium succinatutens TaxID=626940 RepID=UPI00307DF13B